MLRSATLMLQQAEQGSDSIPVGVLNATKCLLIINEVAPEEPRKLALKTCRNADQWPAPDGFTVQLSDIHPAVNGRVLLLILGDKEAREVAAGNLRLGAIPEGPLVSTASAKSASELPQQNAFAYAVEGKSLHSIAIGSVTGEADSKTSELLQAEIEHPIAADGKPGADVEESWFVRQVNGFFATILPSGIMIHHSAILPPDPSQPAADYLDQFHAARGFSITCGGRTYHVAYHYIILPSGEVQLGRPDRCEGAHTRGFNGYIGIVLVGDFSSKDNPKSEKGPNRPTSEQMARLVTLCRHLREQYHIPIQRILRHGDVGSTACPGDNFPFSQFLARLLEAPDGNAQSSQK